MGAASGAVLPELFGGIERKPVQAELSNVRVLFELLGFLLSVQDLALVRWPDMTDDLRLQWIWFS
jgi:hypothetical protein